MCKLSPKILVIIISTVFLLMGVLLLLCGIHGKMEEDKVPEDIFDEMQWAKTGSKVLIAVGGIIIVVSLFGYCAIASEPTIKFFAILLTIAFLTQVAAGLYLVTIRDEILIEYSIFDAVVALYRNYGKNPKAMDSIQLKMECCGSRSPKEYKKLPDSCFPYNDRTQAVFKEGCADKLMLHFAYIIRFSNTIVIATAAFEVLVVCMAFCFSSCWIQDDEAFFGGVYLLNNNEKSVHFDASTKTD